MYILNELKIDESTPSDLPDYPFTQNEMYGDWQIKSGHKVRRFLISENGETYAYFQLIFFPLAFGKKYGYSPYGPVIAKTGGALFQFIKTEIKKIAIDENAVFARLDFTPFVDEKILLSHFVKASSHTLKSAHFQPRAEWMLGLSKTEEDLLKDMHEKTRYSIRLSERKEIKSEIISSNFIKHTDVFLSLMSETAERNGFKLHENEYYKNIFKRLKSPSYISVASFNGKILSINLIIVFNGIANFVFGASSSEERNRMHAYSAHWVAIQHARKIGCKFYNFGGISYDGQNQSWDNLTTFKKKFGGEEVRHSALFDVIVSRFWYTLYNVRKFLQSLRK